eukprot:CAMPEP_0196669194 /NCGR_PEP_ID=MMETSP1090-20130531/463_1 /TAXON_ID=37098 /ORGANISM="Isochrysis sp, Strain CCMP1244" /LENGTH=120 /DNA_ID=CAMNT_0042006697 /DNA_START=349 /DNA_END=711 /DNA_ORIENTATION=+
MQLTDKESCGGSRKRRLGEAGGAFASFARARASSQPRHHSAAAHLVPARLLQLDLHPALLPERVAANRHPRGHAGRAWLDGLPAPAGVPHRRPAHHHRHARRGADGERAVEVERGELDVA